MQNTKKDLFKSATILLIIVSLLFCVSCKAFEGNRFYFATSNNGVGTLNLQYLASTSSLQFDFAGEETLRSATSSYSNFNQTLIRSQRITSPIQFIFALIPMAAVLVLTNILRSYGCQIMPRRNFSSIRIARFIEHSDGKK